MSYPLWTDGKAEVGRVSEEMTDYRPFEGVTHDFISRNWIASETEKKNSLCNLPRVHHVAVGLANVVAHTSTLSCSAPPPSTAPPWTTQHAPSHDSSPLLGQPPPSMTMPSMPTTPFSQSPPELFGQPTDLHLHGTRADADTGVDPPGFMRTHRAESRGRPGPKRDDPDPNPALTWTLTRAHATHVDETA